MQSALVPMSAPWYKVAAGVREVRAETRGFCARCAVLCQTPEQFDKRRRSERLYTSVFALAAFRVGAFFVLGVFSANSKPTLSFSNFRCAEKGRPFFEMNFGSKSVLPVAINF